MTVWEGKSTLVKTQSLTTWRQTYLYQSVSCNNSFITTDSGFMKVNTHT